MPSIDEQIAYLFGFAIVGGFFMLGGRILRGFGKMFK